MDDSPDEEACDGGSQGDSTKEEEHWATGKQADDENDPDDSLLTLKAASKEVIPSSARPGLFDGKVKQNTIIISRIAFLTAVSIASRAFHAAEVGGGSCCRSSSERDPRERR